MKTFTVDFTGVKTYWEFYTALIKGLGLPDWCGKNPDVIWDMLTGYIECPPIVYLEGINKLHKELNSEKDIIIDVFQEAVKEYGEVEYTLKP